MNCNLESVAAAATPGRLAKLRACILALAAVVATLGAASAYAGCADPRTKVSGQARVTLRAPAGVSAFRGNAASKNIVGTWLVTYTNAGGAAGQAYIQWHADRTEWESINFPIESGNICLGSWMTVDAQHVSRNHYGWLYTAGIVSGYLNEIETAEVMDNGTYNGVTDVKIYNLDGNLLAEIPGTSSAVFLAP